MSDTIWKRPNWQVEVSGDCLVFWAGESLLVDRIHIENSEFVEFAKEYLEKAGYSVNKTAEESEE